VPTPVKQAGCRAGTGAGTRSGWICIFRQLPLLVLPYSNKEREEQTTERNNQTAETGNKETQRVQINRNNQAD